MTKTDIMETGLFGDVEGKDIFVKAVRVSVEAGYSRNVAYARAWGELAKAGYVETPDGTWQRPQASEAQPMYGKRTLLNPDELIEWAREQGFNSVLMSDDFHTTFMHTKRPILFDENCWYSPDTVLAGGGNRWVMALGDKAVCLVYDCPQIVKDWVRTREEFGADWDYPSFMPHVTLTYDSEGLDLSKVTPFEGDLLFGPPEIEPLKGGAMRDIEEQILKRQTDDDLFTLQHEAASQSMALGLNGAVHAITVNGQAVFRPGANEDEYIEAVEGKGLETTTTHAPENPVGAFVQLLSDLVQLIDPKIAKVRKSPEKKAPKASTKVIKMDEEQRIVWGWASVSKIDGELVTDTQGDMLEPEVMVKAANKFMEDVRTGKLMHEGDQIGTVVHSLPLTKELAEALNITTDIEGWIIGMKVHDDAQWERAKKGAFTGFSIGGKAKRHATQ